ncbi:unnamed protein product, partial [Rotaria sp. Silwood2]
PLGATASIKTSTVAFNEHLIIGPTFCLLIPCLVIDIKIHFAVITSHHKAK